MMDELRRKQVYDVLLMPIFCEQHSGFGHERKVEIKKEKNKIITTQIYWQEYKDRNTGETFRYDFQPDCDMSDFACGFYEIIYKDFLNGKKIVDDNGCLVDKEYAGDTMTSVSRLPNLKNKYHCLANFWVIPMELGRKSAHKLSKTSRYFCIEDFMDRFLLLLKYRLNEYKTDFPNYFIKDKFEDFSSLHFLRESYVDGKGNIIQYSDFIDEQTEQYLWNCIRTRANDIAGKYGNELWKYFEKNNLFYE